MNYHNGPASPLSAGSNDSYGRGYGGPMNGGGLMNGGGPPQGGFMGAPSDVPYHGGPYGAARPMQSSPPSSGHPSSATDASRGASSAGRPPSSASSVGGRSDARGMGMGRGNPRDSTRSNFRPEHEDVLQKHYFALRTYLAAHLRDEKGNMKPNRARDKLLRLSVTQFMELSTDVYDELIRREDERSHRVPNVPRFLPPKQSFHPKRNQARQKLSTLPVERFRQLATDVFFELERRVPRFGGGGGDFDRPQSRGGMRPPPNGWRGPPGSRSRQGSDASNMGRPFPKNFQGGTVVPNKSTMVEDDEEELDDGLSGRYSEHERDKETIRSQESEIDELKKQSESMQSQLLEKNNELARMRDSHEQVERGLHTERGEWHGLREDLEQKVSDAERLHESLRDELELLKRSKIMDEQSLREQVDGSSRELDMLRAHHDNLQHQYSQLQNNGRHGAGSEEQEHRISILESELSEQQKITNEVREDALSNLQEMRELSKQHDQAVEQEERLAAQVTTLEQEIADWRERYAKVKALNKSLRASTMGLTLSNAFNAGSLMRKEGLISRNGLVKDVDVTRFQLAIDDLLAVARKTDTSAMISSVKQVTLSVQAISVDVGTDGYPTPAPSPHGHSTADASVAKLKARVTGTANSLITATKQHASACGLSPVALLDAAASNLTASVVELIKAVGIRPSSGDEHRDADLESFYGDAPSEVYDHHPMPSLQTAAVAVQHSGGQQGIVRGNSSNKPAGWFNWGRGTSGEHDGTSSGGHDDLRVNNGHGHGHDRGNSSDDYDHYS